MEPSEMTRYDRAVEVVSGNISTFLAQLHSNRSDFALVGHLAKLIEEHAHTIREAAERAAFFKTIGLFETERTALSAKPDDFVNKFTPL